MRRFLAMGCNPTVIMPSIFAGNCWLGPVAKWKGAGEFPAGAIVGDPFQKAKLRPSRAMP